MVAYGPVFCDITWGAGGTTADVTLDIATRMQTQVGGHLRMHYTRSCWHASVRVPACCYDAQ